LPSGDPFDQLKGDWKGGGRVILNDGTVKQVTCTAKYKTAGSNVTQTMNCKGNDYEVNATLKVTDKDGKMRGSWNESVYAASGSVSGTAKGNLVHAVIAGDKFSGRMSIKLTDKGHTINVLQRDANSLVVRRKREDGASRTAAACRWANVCAPPFSSTAAPQRQ
jgi:hypothetical protein